MCWCYVLCVGVVSKGRGFDGHRDQVSFSACPAWIHTRSNTRNIEYTSLSMMFCILCGSNYLYTTTSEHPSVSPITGKQTSISIYRVFSPRPARANHGPRDKMTICEHGPLSLWKLLMINNIRAPPAPLSPALIFSHMNGSDT